MTSVTALNNPQYMERHPLGQAPDAATWLRWCTWELPQTLAGATAATVLNLAGRVSSVSYLEGAWVVRTQGQWGGLTLGPVILGDQSLAAQRSNRLFRHEWGHTRQSAQLGPLYLLAVGLPSLVTAALGRSAHAANPVEQDADRRSEALPPA